MNNFNYTFITEGLRSPNSKEKVRFLYSTFLRFLKTHGYNDRFNKLFRDRYIFPYQLRHDLRHGKTSYERLLSHTIGYGLPIEEQKFWAKASNEWLSFVNTTFRPSYFDDADKLKSLTILISRKLDNAQCRRLAKK